MENTRLYHYPTLRGPKSIRLLLLSGGRAKPLSAELIETTLRNNIPYEAISYVWGDSAKSRSLLLQDGTSLKITKSLHHTLRSIRHSIEQGSVRALWADGACINQNDPEERGQQVKLMAEIYRLASRVITYVGEDTANVNLGIDLANRLILCSKELGTHTTPALAVAVYRKYNIPHISHPAWHSLEDFLCRPWYTRIWIVQESLLNNTMLLMCGQATILWELFTQLNEVTQKGAFNQFSTIQPKSERQVGAMGQMARLRVGYRQRQLSLLELLASCRDLECSDPRDRVFALSSLVEDIEIKPDYTKSCAHVFTEIANILLLSYGLVALSYAGINRSLKIPSWVPDWSLQIEQIPVFQCRLFNASGGALTQAKPQINTASGSLSLSGKIHDKIVHVTDTLRRVFVTARMARYFWARDQYLRLASSTASYPGGGSYLEAFWRTIVCDLDPKARFQVKGASASLARDFEAYVRPDKAYAKWEAGKTLPAPNAPAWAQPPEMDPAVVSALELERDMDVSSSEAGDSEESIFNSLHGNHPAPYERGDNYRDVILHAGSLYRKFFTTEKGYIGMSAKEIDVGDVVAFFRDGTARVPYVLRPQQGGIPIKKYLLVADCFVYGLMNGEAFNSGSGEGKKVIELV